MAKHNSFVVGLFGGACSGKTTLAQALLSHFKDASFLSLDNYFEDFSSHPVGTREKINFDQPSAIRWSVVEGDLFSLKRGQPVRPPHYNFATHTHDGTCAEVQPKPIILAEGFLLGHSPAVRALCDLLIYVDCPDEVRFARKMVRDVRDRGRTPEYARWQWAEFTKPMQAKWVAPTREFAHIIIDGMASTADQIAVITSSLRPEMKRAVG